MTHEELIAKTVARAKTQILDDIDSGIVPEDVDSFSRLHDYTDANMYGSLDDGTFELPVGEHLEDFVNEVQGRLDEWLKARIERWLKIRQAYDEWRDDA